jgi:hypothetical protein
MSPEDVPVLTTDEVHAAIERGLADLGLTLDELQEQAETDTFASEDARLLWFAIQDVVAAA